MLDSLELGWTLGPGSKCASEVCSAGVREALHVLEAVLKLEVTVLNAGLQAADIVSSTGGMPTDATCRFSLTVSESSADADTMTPLELPAARTSLSRLWRCRSGQLHVGDCCRRASVDADVCRSACGPTAECR